MAAFRNQQQSGRDGNSLWSRIAEHPRVRACWSVIQKRPKVTIGVLVGLTLCAGVLIARSTAPSIDADGAADGWVLDEHELSGGEEGLDLLAGAEPLAGSEAGSGQATGTSSDFAQSPEDVPQTRQPLAPVRDASFERPSGQELPLHQVTADASATELPATAEPKRSIWLTGSIVPLRVGAEATSAPAAVPTRFASASQPPAWSGQPSAAQRPSGQPAWNAPPQRPAVPQTRIIPARTP